MRYAADTGNDDTVMTIVNGSSVFSKTLFKEMVESIAHELVDSSTLSYYNDILKNQEFVDYNKNDGYSSLLNVNRQRRFMNNFNQNQNKGGSWFK